MSVVDEILKTDYSEEFDSKRKALVCQSYYKYGKASSNFSTGNVDAIGSLKKCLDKFEETHNTGDYSDCHSVHAEQNAMLSAARKDMIGATMYLAGEERKWSDVNQSYFDWKCIEQAEPCPICARMILNAGIKNVKNEYGTLRVDKFI